MVASLVALVACAPDEPPGAGGTDAQQKQPGCRPSKPKRVDGSLLILDRDFPDPTVIRTSDGTFYGYATQDASRPTPVNIQVARSEDLRRWCYLGDALPDKPSWAGSTQDFWAPHVLEHRGTFYMYFSAVPDDALDEEFCLAVATSSDPGGPFEPAGEPMLCGVEIDPMVMRTKEGDWLMYWAAGGDIAVQRLTSDLMHVEGAFPQTLLQGWTSPVRRPYERLVEGPFVVYRGGWYYLLYSGDSCCEFPAHYAVLVARARDPEGPFRRLGSVTGRASSVILRAHGRWNGPGHGSVVADASGGDWYAYHAIDKRQPYLPDGGVRRVMLLDRLTFSDGWPAIGERRGSSRG